MGLAEVRRIFNTKPLTSLATCYISYPLPGKFWGIFGNLPAVLFIQNWLLLKTGCFYSASPDWWLWAGKHSNGWHSIKLSYKMNYCMNIAKGTSECKMARCYYLECARCIFTIHIVLMHGSCLAYQSRPPRQGKWCCHHWLCSLDVDTSAFFRKLLTELSATLLSRTLLSEIAHTESLWWQRWLHTATTCRTWSVTFLSLPQLFAKILAHHSTHASHPRISLLCCEIKLCFVCLKSSFKKDD